jgi:hypothetical protein
MSSSKIDRLPEIPREQMTDAQRTAVDELITVSCSDCGLGHIDPLPTDQELAEWYATQYRQAYKSAVQPALRHVLRAGRNAQWR